MMRVKKLVFILSSLHCGGAQRVLINLLNALDPDRYKAVLMLIKKEGELLSEVPQHVTLDFCLTKEQGFWKNIFRVILALKRHKDCDCFIGGIELDATYVAVLGKLFYKTKAIGWVHTNLPRFIKDEMPLRHTLLVPFFYPRLDHIVAVSTGVKKSLLDTYHGFHRPITVIYNIIPPYYIPGSVRETKKTETNSVSTKPFIVTIGRLVYTKGYDILLNAFSTVTQTIDCNLCIIGDGPEKEKLIHQSRTLSLDKKVIFTGYIKNPLEILKEAELYVLSSRFEGFAAVLVEAMMCGIPIVSTRCDFGPEEILENGTYGVLTPVENSNALAQGIIDLLHNDKQRSMLKIQGVERAKCFYPESIIPQVDEFFKHL